MSKTNHLHPSSNEVTHDWVQRFVYNQLIANLKTDNSQQQVEDYRTLLETRAYLVGVAHDSTETPQINEQVQAINLQLESLAIKRSALSWIDIKKSLLEEDYFHQVAMKAAAQSDEEKDLYAQMWLLDLLAKPRKTKHTLENLGLVEIVYPTLIPLDLPQEAKLLDLDTSSWQAFLKIALDYQIRRGRHIACSNGLDLFSQRNFSRGRIFASYSPYVGEAKWPGYRPHSYKQEPLVLLLLAGLGIHWPKDLDSSTIANLENLLQHSWQVLCDQVLIENKGGYLLDLFSEPVALQIGEIAFRCPYLGVLVGNVFKGYSPWIKGKLDPKNMDRYRVDEFQTA